MRSKVLGFIGICLLFSANDRIARSCPPIACPRNGGCCMWDIELGAYEECFIPPAAPFECHMPSQSCPSLADKCLTLAMGDLVVNWGERPEGACVDIPCGYCVYEENRACCKFLTCVSNQLDGKCRANWQCVYEDAGVIWRAGIWTDWVECCEDVQ